MAAHSDLSMFVRREGPLAQMDVAVEGVGCAGCIRKIENGLKQRDSGEVMEAFLDSIKPAMKASGLTFPDPKKLGVVVPSACDFSLDRVPAS